MKTTAAVAIAPGSDFEVREIEIQAPRENEILVRVHAAGICHTDIAVREQHLPTPLPAVLGHEGAGIVEAVGAKVTKVKPGDRVAMTFMSCGECDNCSAGHPAYCAQFNMLNGYGRRPDGSATLHGEDGAEISGAFFGQSSFAGYALCYERNTVLLPAGISLDVAAPFGCGVQTGAGAVMRALDCRPGSSLLVIGGGTVGLSALLAGVVRGCGRLIVSEPSAERRTLATSLGATEVIDPFAGSLSDQLATLLPEGVDYVLDTSGRVEAIEASIAALAPRGAIGLVGMPSDPTTNFSANLLSAVGRGISIHGIVEGDSDIDDFLHELMELHLAGKFPIDRLITRYALAEINAAVHDQHAGKSVKAVLIPG